MFARAGLWEWGVVINEIHSTTATLGMTGVGVVIPTERSERSVSFLLYRE